MALTTDEFFRVKDDDLNMGIDTFVIIRFGTDELFFAVEEINSDSGHELADSLESWTKPAVITLLALVKQFLANCIDLLIS